MDFETWKEELVTAYIRRGGMTLSEAKDYVDNCDWEDYYASGSTPDEAAQVDISYWED